MLPCSSPHKNKNHDLKLSIGTLETGLQIKYHAMRAGKGGEVVSIRISQQLL